MVYMSIYINAHPEKAQDLLKYMHTVRLGASRSKSQGWRLYDEHFRRKMANSPSTSWQYIDYELWLVYMSSNTNPTHISNNTNKPLPTHNKCFEFNNKGVCNIPNCIYTHGCIQCGLGHAKLNCSNPSITNQKQHLSFRPNSTPNSHRNTSYNNHTHNNTTNYNNRQQTSILHQLQYQTNYQQSYSKYNQYKYNKFNKNTSR